MQVADLDDKVSPLRSARPVIDRTLNLNPQLKVDFEHRTDSSRSTNLPQVLTCPPGHAWKGRLVMMPRTILVPNVLGGFDCPSFENADHQR